MITFCRLETGEKLRSKISKQNTVTDHGRADTVKRTEEMSTMFIGTESVKEEKSGS